MLINTRINIALKNILESYTVDSINIFNMETNSKDLYNITIHNKKELIISAICPLCGRQHSYKFNINRLVTSGVNIGGCDVTGEPVIIIGDMKKVEDIISKYKEIYTKIPLLI